MTDTSAHRSPPHAGASPRTRGRWSFPGAEAGALREAAFVFGSLLLIALVALLDLATGRDLSFSIFYVLPVAVCARYGGFAHGSLVALAGAAAWHGVDLAENPAIPPVATAWNGVVRFGTLILVCCLVGRLRAGILRERQLARTDPLTGAANARTFYEAAAAEASRARRAGRPLTLAYLDLDNFKQLNDRLGHGVGDEALRNVVETITGELRASDLLARLGGDEFALLLPETGGPGAAALLDRLHKSASGEMARRGWPVTLSVGAITFPRPAVGVDVMIGWVDSLMYTAKKKGKARVEHVVSDGEQPPQSQWRGTEKRAAARVLCNRTARVYQEGQEEFATIRDLSAHGVGLHLERPLPPEALVVIEGFSPDVKTLLAKVVRVVPDEGGWLHGCALMVGLSDEELQAWLAAWPLPNQCAIEQTAASRQASAVTSP